MRRQIRASAAAILGIALCAGHSAGAVATRTVALYEMNEPPGSTVLVDSSGGGLNGSIGDEVLEGTSAGGAIVHRFSYLAPNTPSAHPGHLDKVPNNTKLNPGSREFAVTMRAKWTQNFGNMIQKGQSGVAGGYFKWEAPNGIVRCVFRDATGVTLTASSKTALNNGQYHVIRCERTTQGVMMTVDGAVRSSIAGSLGLISNTWPLSIGGKSSCDQIRVTCDYFVGDIDSVRIEKG